MDMPSVKRCDAEECAYNKGRQCHALAITVGDEMHPRCDTFCAYSFKGGDSTQVGRVGACKVSDCTYNEKLECSASSIYVGPHMQKDFDCKTYEKRQ